MQSEFIVCWRLACHFHPSSEFLQFHVTSAAFGNQNEYEGDVNVTPDTGVWAFYADQHLEKIYDV